MARVCEHAETLLVLNIGVIQLGLDLSRFDPIIFDPVQAFRK
jgi:hypothetical protein